jgi:hypothetical protein
MGVGPQVGGAPVQAGTEHKQPDAARHDEVLLCQVVTRVESAGRRQRPPPADLEGRGVHPRGILPQQPQVRVGQREVVQAVANDPVMGVLAGPGLKVAVDDQVGPLVVQPRAAVKQPAGDPLPLRRQLGGGPQVAHDLGIEEDSTRAGPERLVPGIRSARPERQ